MLIQKLGNKYLFLMFNVFIKGNHFTQHFSFKFILWNVASCWLADMAQCSWGKNIYMTNFLSMHSDFHYSTSNPWEKKISEVPLTFILYLKKYKWRNIHYLCLLCESWIINTMMYFRKTFAIKVILFCNFEIFYNFPFY